MGASRFLIDTNVLLRIVRGGSPAYAVLRQSIDQLKLRGHDISYSSQVLAELWNVCTRPSERNGFGLTIAETDTYVRSIEAKFTLAPDSHETHRLWRELVLRYSVAGVQVHDARLVATMRVNGIGSLLTFNGRDFRRYEEISVISPQDVVAS